MVPRKQSSSKSPLLVLTIFCLGLTLLSPAHGLDARTIGQFYWHLPNILSFTNSQGNDEFSRPPTTSSFLGFTVTLGNDAKPAHLADISINYYGSTLGFIPGITSRYQTVNLGYVWHYSTNYSRDRNTRAHNLQIAVGLKQFGNTQNALGIGVEDTANGLYLRFAYFRSYPFRSKSRALVGFHIEFAQFARFNRQLSESLVTDLNAQGNSDPFDTPATFYNHANFALIFGRDF